MMQPADPVAHAVATALDALLAGHATLQTPQVSIAVALSGGRDSMTLLHALARARESRGVALSAIHVHHGLSPNADEWAQFCERQCARMDVPLHVERVRVQVRGGESVEDLARRARIDALLRHEVNVVALAHHADDQAETLLLQLMRGAGPHGLAAMPLERSDAQGPRLLRPLLHVSGALVAAYARTHSLAWIEDESNFDSRYRRNAVRHRVVPALREIFPGYPATLVRAASHQAEAAALLDELAELDCATVVVHDAQYDRCLDHRALVALALKHPARARNLVRWFLRSHGVIAPTAARLHELLAQCIDAQADSRLSMRHANVSISLHRGRLVVHPIANPAVVDVPWRGERDVQCPGGVMRANTAIGAGIAATLVATGSLRLRTRAGGERLATASGRQVAVSRLFSERGTPRWQRDEWPLVCIDDRVVAVPGIAIDAQHAAQPQTPGFVLQWQPRRISAPK